MFGDGYFSKSFWISRQDWFSSTIKSTKTFKVVLLAWWAMWVRTPGPVPFPCLASGLSLTSNLKSYSTGVTPCSLLVSQAGTVNSSFNLVISPTTKQFVIPQNQESGHSDFNFSSAPTLILILALPLINCTVNQQHFFLSLLPAEKNA